MSPATALPIIAMRLRMAMQRHARQTVDTTRLLADRLYADEILQACRAVGLPDVTALADQFESARNRQSGQTSQTSRTAAPAAAAAPAPPPAAPRAGDAAPVSHSPRLTPAAASATRPPPGAPPSTGGYVSTGPSTNGGSDTHDTHDPNDPNDPHNPRTRRYLRGAR